jgi:replication initiation protein RepC
MQQISLTSFGRQQVTAGLLAHQTLASAPAPLTTPDKWAVLRDLTAARLDFGLTDRDLTVLAALLSFHPGKDLSDDDHLMVFPSNRSLSDRAHGMAESTLRRHIGALVRAGLILRNDSPNGKRYATRDISGALDHVFGFNLRPLLVRAAQIAIRADQARDKALRLRRQREMAVIALRDAMKLIDWCRNLYPADWDALSDSARLLQRDLRRKLDHDALIALTQDANALLVIAKSHVPSPEPTEMSGSDSQNERHYQNSDKEDLDSEPAEQTLKRPPVLDQPPAPPNLPLHIVLKAVPEFTLYAEGGVDNWRDLVKTAHHLRPMMGIDPDVWDQALRNMGPEVAAITLACMLQNSTKIARPGGYLRTLTAKAAAGTFSPGPMVMALLRLETHRAA